VPGWVGDIVATGRLRRLFWRVADDLDYPLDARDVAHPRQASRSPAGDAG
jgi:hypothetical protein